MSTFFRLFSHKPCIRFSFRNRWIKQITFFVRYCSNVSRESGCSVSHRSRNQFIFEVWNDFDTGACTLIILRQRLYFAYIVLTNKSTQLFFSFLHRWYSLAFTSCSKTANKLSTSCVCTACPKLSTRLEQLVNSCNNLVDTIRLVARLFQQVWYCHNITILLQPCVL